MSLATDNIQAQINLYIGAYAVDAFHNKNLNRILLLMLQLLSNGGSAPTAGMMFHFTSANFINATDCPIPSLLGQNLVVFWAEPPKTLIQGTNFTLLPGGGFSVTDAGFDAITGSPNYNFFVSVTP